MPIPTIIVHGGAGAIAPDVWREYMEGAGEAARAGQAVLDEGASALDAAIAATIYMENHPAFNAGRGSGLNRDGRIECDAFVMRDDLQSGAVACVSNVRNPVLLARVVLEQTPHQLVVGAGAEELARVHGIPLCANEELIVPKRLARWQQMTESGVQFTEQLGPEDMDNPKQHAPGSGGVPPPKQDGGQRPPLPGDDTSDTVGAIAIDAAGRIATASSTGGIMLKLPGRAGDTPVIGAGGYCGPAGSATCTGHGEAVMRVCLAKYAYDLLAAGCDAYDAAIRAVDHLVDAVQGIAGVIVLDRFGNRAWATSTTRIAVGLPEQPVDANAGYVMAGLPPEFTKPGLVSPLQPPPV